jgi:hypothetical protein
MRASGNHPMSVEKKMPLDMKMNWCNELVRSAQHPATEVDSSVDVSDRPECIRYRRSL